MKNHALQKRLLFIICILCIGLLATRAGAQSALPDAGTVEPQQTHDILNKEMKDSEAAYKSARDALSDEQKKLLGEIGESYLLALAPEIEVVRLGMQLKACPFKKDEKEEAASIFAAFKLEKKNERQKIMQMTAAKYKKKTDFIDPEILTKHIATVMYFGKQVSLDTLKAQTRQLIKADRSSVCEEGKATLKAFAG